LESFKRYRERNRTKIRARLAVSKQGREKRRVLWANQDAIRAIYDQAEFMTRTTGRLHVVDHEIPLQGDEVSGLHVETNLRVVEHHENAVKHNTWESPGWQRPGDVGGTSRDAETGQPFLAANVCYWYEYRGRESEGARESPCLLLRSK
jgi:hypothetical protein